MRHVVKYYRFVDIMAVVMCLLTSLLSSYWYIYLIVYFVLRLVFLAFYWPHIWCKCICASKALILLCSTVTILIFSCYIGILYLAALPYIFKTDEKSVSKFFLIILPLLLIAFILSVICCRIGWEKLLKGKLPPFKRHPRADSMHFRWGYRGAYFYR